MYETTCIFCDNSNVFVASDVYVNWTDARDICKRTHRSAHLVAIETEAEHEYLKGKWMVERGRHGNIKTRCIPCQTVVSIVYVSIAVFPFEMLEILCGSLRMEIL